MQEIKIQDIKSTFSIRAPNRAFIEHLKTEFKSIGFQKANPVSITDEYVLWDGNHRLQAARELEWKSIWAVIETPDNLRRAAHERNRASQNALPETFVDHAQEIWQLLSTGKTQQQVGDELGWSQPRVNQYAKLETLQPNVWGFITEHVKAVIPSRNNAVIENITSVITEGLLRNLLDLTEHHQLAIVLGLISGAVGAGRVKKQADEYRQREQFALIAIDCLMDNADKERFFSDCLAGLYNSEEQLSKAIKQANEEFQKKNQIRIINADCMDALYNIEPQSIDLLLTDPPYGITDQPWDKFDSKDEYLQFSTAWMRAACDVVKSTGRIYICWSQEYIRYFPYDAIDPRFKFGNMLIWNYPNNIKPNDQRKHKYTYEPIFYFYGIDAPKLNLPKSETWDESLNDYDVFRIAQPQTNYKEKKVHHTQKPVELFTRIMAVGSEIGDVVLDLFAGSGTTGVVAKKLKRKAILVERDPEYCKVIASRLLEVE